MSFLYEAMKNRGKGKRKIKPNEDNLLRMLAEMNSESEEDEDFEVAEEPEDSTGTESSNENEKAESDQNENDNVDKVIPVPEAVPIPQKISQKSQKKHTKKRRKRASKYDVNFSDVGLSPENKVPKINAKSGSINAVEKCKAQLKSSQKLIESRNILHDICCVCLTKNDSNKLTCQKCGLVIHNDCYGFPFTTISIVNNKNSPNQKKTWFCDKCVCNCKNSSDFGCEFCSTEFGLLKESFKGQWSHIICAKYILGKDMFNDNAKGGVELSPRPQNFKSLCINMEMVNFKNYGVKQCVLCTNALLAKSGISIKCDAGFCNVFFHVTCAQKHGLLVSNESERNKKEFYAYCPLHCSKHEMKTMQENYFRTVHYCKNAISQFKQNNALMESLEILRFSTLKNKLNALKNSKNHSDQFKPRMLNSNAYFSEMLNRKAKNLYGDYILNPDIQVPSPSKIRTKRNVEPALTTEFSAYYADRQLRFWELESEIKEHKNLNEKLFVEEKQRRTILEQRRGRQLQLQSEGNVIKNKIHAMKNMLHSLKNWSAEPVSSQEVFSKLSPQVHIGNKSKANHQHDILRVVIPELSSNHPVSFLKSCGICKKNNNQHLMVKCDVCLEWQHLGCLDPPLRQMPKKNKFKLWQCSECANSDGDMSTDSVDTNLGSFIATDGRRLTTRSRKAPEKLLTKLLVEKTTTELYETFNKKKKRKRKTKKIKPKSFSVEQNYSGSSDESMTLMELKRKTEIQQYLDNKIDTSDTDIELCESSSTPVRNNSIPSTSNFTTTSIQHQEIPNPVQMPANCCVCNEEKGNKKIATCSSCRKVYHWGCCEPPIRFNPTPNRYHRWNCTECADTTSSEEETKVLETRLRKVSSKFDDYRVWNDEAIVIE